MTVNSRSSPKLFFLCIVINLVVLSVLLYVTRYNRAMAATETLHVVQMTTQVDGLRRKVADLEHKSQLASKKNRLSRLNLSKLNVRLRRENEKFAVENEKLRTENAKLQIENVKLQQDNEKMKSQCADSKREIELLKAQYSNVTTNNKPSFTKRIPSERKLNQDKVDIANTIDKFQKSVTVVIFNDLSEECLIEQLVNIFKTLPNIKVVVSTYIETEKISKKFTNCVFIKLVSNQKEGNAINTMLDQVTTDYFIYLSHGASFYEYRSNNGPGWLLHAFDNIPELDFIGAGLIWDNNSTSRYARFEINCYRLKMCYWTFEQTYEYQYSVGNMMVCEETSSSFMGRLSSFRKYGRFDPNLDSMVTSDYFWRIKSKAVVGLMPEVFFYVGSSCKRKLQPEVDVSLEKQAFMDKYDLWRVKDSYGKVTDYPKEPKRPPAIKSVVEPMPTELGEYNRQGGFGPPDLKQDLQFFVSFFDDFFTSKNITYDVNAGVSLGGIKTRNVLPWDNGDVDRAYYGVHWKTLYNDIKAYAKERNVDISVIDTYSGTFPDGSDTRLIEVTRGGRWWHDHMYSHDYMLSTPPRPDEMMTITINGRQIPVQRTIFDEIRTEYGYGNDYLRMQNTKGDLKCLIPGHHACVPDEFSQGGGHWSDFYCH